MRIKVIALALAVSLGAAIFAQSSMPPGQYMSAGEFAGAIEQSAGDRPGMAVGRMTNTDHRINMIHRTQAAGAIIHEVGTELHYITDGAGTLVTGGVIVRPQGGGRANIEGGKAQRVGAGDAVLIPEGTPHQYTAVEGSVTYLEVRF
jgi:mannose-6-phosphate isomerase-like protein (cupin superfamily)